jgi:hypothetical protein
VLSAVDQVVVHPIMTIMLTRLCRQPYERRIKVTIIASAVIATNVCVQVTSTSNNDEITS